MGKDAGIKKLREFGWVVGGFFLLVGLAPLRKGLPLRLWALFPGGLLLVLAVLRPSVLRAPQRAWMKLAEALGWLNSRVLLTLIFFFVVTPLALLRRLFGQKGESRGSAQTYAVAVETRDPKHMELQY